MTSVGCRLYHPLFQKKEITITIFFKGRLNRKKRVNDRNAMPWEMLYPTHSTLDATSAFYKQSVCLKKKKTRR